MKKIFTLLSLLLCAVGVANAWTDIKLDFTKDTQYAFSGLGTSTTLYIAADGTVSATSAAGDLGTIRGQFHSATYGLQNFTASINVPANVKITYGENDYGNNVTITNSSSQKVGTINNYNGTGKWATGNTDLLATTYYTQEATTLNFSNCNYVGYFAIEALSAEEIAALSTSYNHTYDLTSSTTTTDKAFEAYNNSYNGGHGWQFGTNGYVKLLVGEYADISLSLCSYSQNDNMTVTYPDGSSETVSQYSATDGASTTVTYAGGKPGYVKFAFTATSKSVYVHNIVVQNYGAIATIGATGWATLSSNNILDFSSAIDNLTAAYIVTGASGTSITSAVINAPIAADQGILLNGAGTVKIPGAATATFDASANLLKAGGEYVTKEKNSGFNYALSEDEGKATFKRIVSSFTPYIDADKAYLALKSDPGASARELLAIDGEATAIKNIKVGTEDNVYYDLQGRRILYPTKGLYIVNGKKVILK